MIGTNDGVCTIASANVADQHGVELQIILRHAFGGKALLETTPDLRSVEGEDVFNLKYRLLDAIHHVARHAVVHDLGNRTSPKGQDRCAARHRLDHHESKWLRPIDGEQQGACVAEEPRLLTLV